MSAPRVEGAKQASPELPSWHQRQAELQTRFAKRGYGFYEAKGEPVWLEVSEASWRQAFNEMPPIWWVRGRGPETFVLSEMWADLWEDGPRGPIATMFARSMGRYYVTLAPLVHYDLMRSQVPVLPSPNDTASFLEPLARVELGDQRVG